MYPMEYGDCSKHPAIKFADTESLTTLAFHVKHNALTLTMFHDHVWRDKSFQNHLNNPLIFEGFPISVDGFYHGHCVPDYSQFKEPIRSSFNDIEWLFPREQTELYLGNWDMKTPFYNLKPILEDWNNVVTNIKRKFAAQMQISRVEAAMANKNDIIKVCITVTYYIICVMIGVIFVIDVIDLIDVILVI